MNEESELLPNLTEDLHLVAVPDGWSLPWWGYLVILAVLVAFCLPLYFALRKRTAKQLPPPPEPKPDPAQIALEHLARLRETAGVLSPRELSLEGSSLLRDYVEARFGIRAPFQTTSEFLRLAATTTNFPHHETGAIEDVLRCCDRIKFAAATTDSDTFGPLLDTLHAFITRTAGVCNE